MMEEFLKNLKLITDWFSDNTAELGGLILAYEDVLGIYTLIVRWILPILAVLIFIRCILPLLYGEKRNTVWGVLQMQDGTRTPLTHWENSIGRGKLCDILIDLSFVSRNHAVLTYLGGDWMVTDMGSKGGVEVNGKKVDKQERVHTGDTISFAGVEMKLLPAGEAADITQQDEKSRSVWAAWSAKASRAAGRMKPGITLLLILLFQILGGIQVCIAAGRGLIPAIPISIVLFMIAEILFYFIMRPAKRYFELELLCFFLCGMSLFVVSSAAPEALYKQLIAIAAGMAAYTVLGLVLRSFALTRILKYIMAGVSLLLLAATFAVGETRFGARNWINLGFITFQPSEFVKVAFVLAGSATLERLLTKRNLTAFIGFSGACVGALVLMRDLGTAVIFFGTFLVIAFLRSGDVRVIAVITGLAVFGAIAVIAFLPYIASRFQAWGHVWEYANSSGYQQTRTMIYAASGGLLGVGGGNGYLVNIAAADTDLVFGILCEEWGLLIAVAVVLTIVAFAAFAVKMSSGSRSSIYAIAACGAASIFLIQAALNVFGSVDILPLTGVTLPFVSNGGSSMLASWSLMAFIKASDERTRPGKMKLQAGKGETP